MSKRSFQPRQSELESANQEERNTELERVHWLFTSMKTLNYSRLSEMFPELKSSMLLDWISYNLPQEVNWEDLSSGHKVHSLILINYSEHTDIHQSLRTDINCWDHSSQTQIWLESSTLTKSKRRFKLPSKQQSSMKSKRRTHWRTQRL